MGRRSEPWHALPVGRWLIRPNAPMDVELFLIALAVLGASLILALILHVANRLVRRSSYPTLLSDVEQRFSWTAFEARLRTFEMRFAALGVGMLFYTPGCLCYMPNRKWIVVPMKEEDEMPSRWAERARLQAHEPVGRGRGRGGRRRPASKPDPFADRPPLRRPIRPMTARPGVGKSRSCRPSARASHHDAGGGSDGGQIGRPERSLCDGARTCWTFNGLLGMVLATMIIAIICEPYEPPPPAPFGPPPCFRRHPRRRQRHSHRRRRLQRRPRSPPPPPAPPPPSYPEPSPPSAPPSPPPPYHRTRAAMGVYTDCLSPPCRAVISPSNTAARRAKRRCPTMTSGARRTSSSTTKGR